MSFLERWLEQSVIFSRMICARSGAAHRR